MAATGGRPPHTAPDPVQLPLPRLLARAGAAVASTWRRLAATHGLSGTAVVALTTLAAAPGDGRTGRTHRDLAADLGVAPATLTPVVDALESAGAVRRERDAADRRVVRLAVTPAGRRLAAGCAALDAGMAARLPPLRPPEEAVVREFLVAVLAVVTEDGGDGRTR